MASFDVKIDNLDSLKNAYQQAPNIVGPIIQQAIDRSPDVLASHTVSPTVPYRTGQLQQTFRRDVQKMMARWFPTVKYAPFVEFGTAPHVILPKSIGYRGHPGGLKTPFGVFNKVNHPGSKPNKYMERILDASVSEINQLFKEAGDLIAQKLSNK